MENISGSRFLPRWAERVTEVNHAYELKFLTVKKVDASDISEQHNGFLLPRDVLGNKLLEYFTYEETEKISIFLFNEIRRRIDSEASSSSARRKYDGLNVSVFVQGGWRLELFLKHNDESGDTVIKGNELELLRIFGNFKEGDNVAIWIFRYIIDHVNEISKVCFCFVKIDSSIMIAETSETESRLAVL